MGGGLPQAVGSARLSCGQGTPSGVCGFEMTWDASNGSQMRSARDSMAWFCTEVVCWGRICQTACGLLSCTPFARKQNHAQNAKDAKNDQHNHHGHKETPQDEEVSM